MKAVGYEKNGPIAAVDSLVDFEAQRPSPGEHDLLVQVRAISVNPIDTKVRTRKAPQAGQKIILGWDAAGVVVARGPACKLFREGDEVFYAGALDRPGSNAQFQVVDERIVGRKPAKLGFAEAAALPLTSITAWELLFDRLGAARGQAAAGRSILIIGGAGGVGSILIQLARRLTGLTVIATASRPESFAWCLKLGAHHVVDHSKPLPEGLRAAGVPQVDYVASLTATDKHLPAIFEVVKPQGKFGLIDDPPTLDIKPLKAKAVSTHWESMFARSTFHTPDMIAQHELLDEVARLVDAGTIQTTIAERLGVINAANLKKAHTLLESGRSVGKLVLEGF